MNEAFSKFDADKDGFLNVREFCSWAKQSPEVEKILAIFKRIDNNITSSSEAGMASPMTVSHDTHVGISESGAMTIDNIPPSWVQLFKEAGASDQELSDPNMVIMLMGIVAENLNKIANGEAIEKKPASQPSTPSREVPSPPAEKAPEIPEAPANVPPPPAVAPPSVPPPPTLDPGAVHHAPASNKADLMSGIKQGVTLKHAEPAAATKPAATSSIFDEIKKKPTLHHVEPEDIEKMSVDDRNDLTGVLARAIQAHRFKMNVDPDGKEVQEDDDYWDD